MTGGAVSRSDEVRRNIIKVSVKGPLIKVYFNGVKVIEITDSTHTSGKVGLVNWADSAGNFQKFRVYPSE